MRNIRKEISESKKEVATEVVRLHSRINQYRGGTAFADEYKKDFVKVLTDTYTLGLLQRLLEHSEDIEFSLRKEHDNL